MPRRRRLGGSLHPLRIRTVGIRENVEAGQGTGESLSWDRVGRGQSLVLWEKHRLHPVSAPLQSKSAKILATPDSSSLVE